MVGVVWSRNGGGGGGGGPRHFEGGGVVVLLAPPFAPTTRNFDLFQILPGRLIEFRI